MYIKKSVIIDLDGTIYNGQKLVKDADKFIKYLREKSIKLLFVTNRSCYTSETIANKLNKLGIECSRNEVLTSSEATSIYLKNGSIYCIGEIGLLSAFKSPCFKFNSINPEYVIVGFDSSINYEKIKTAVKFIRSGSKFIATNPDVIITSEEGIVPENGAILAAIEAASSVSPQIIGKPSSIIFNIALEKLNSKDYETIVIGDSIYTDILGASDANIDSILVLSGITKSIENLSIPYKPIKIVNSVSDLVGFLSDGVVTT
jgi:4-nitrophenyl phosphatase